MRILLNEDPFLPTLASPSWRERGQWPAQWVGCQAATLPFVAAFRCQFTLAAATHSRMHVSADQRYELFLNGIWIGSGPESGAPDQWFFESYELDLPPGQHTVVALVWALGPHAAIAHMSVQPGFLCAAEGPLSSILTTGHATWEAKLIGGYEFLRSPAHWRASRIRLHSTQHPWGWQQGVGDGWLPVEPHGQAIARRADWEFTPHHLLHPATLPPQIRQPRTFGMVRHIDTAPFDGSPVAIHASNSLGEADWQLLADGNGSVTIAANTTRRVIFDLGDYVCAYPQLLVNGGDGSRMRLYWAEAARATPDPWVHDKGHRDQIEGDYLIGIGDEWVLDGAERTCTPLWWNAGRYLELCIQTEATALTIQHAMLLETRYPLEYHGDFASSDLRLAALLPLLVRGMQMCAHETFMDCPYYEELQYAGDTRLEILTSYMMTNDSRLARKAIRIFDSSRLPSGLTQSRYPSRALQIIAPFAPWWAAMVADYAFWRDDPETVQHLMPGVRATIEAFERYRQPNGLIGAPEGWNYVDWVPEWSHTAGAPPDAAAGISGVVNWLLVYVQTMLAALEAQLDQPEQSARLQRMAIQTAGALDAFWDAARGLYADDLAHTSFSEHSQCLAILSGLLPEARQQQVAAGLLSDPGLARATIYFSHYLFETYRVLGRIDLLLERMELWHGLHENGFRTPVESPEPSRSDCHAWGSHPLFHYGATILGIRPAELGFRSVTIRPQLGPLTWAAGRVPHPRGEIRVEVQRDHQHLQAQIALPDGVSGVLHWHGQRVELHPGQGVYRVEGGGN